MSNLKNKRILILQQRNWGRGIGHHLAKKLQEEGCVLGAITFKRTTHDFTLKQKDVKYDYLWNNDEIMGEPKKYLDGFDRSLKEICEDINIDSLWSLIYALTWKVKSYRDKYYHSFGQNVPDEGIIDYTKVLYKYTKDTFEKFKPDLIIAANFVSFPHAMFYHYAKKRGIKMVCITDSKVRGNFIFTYDPFESTGRFHERVRELNAGLAKSENSAKAKMYIEEFRKEFKKPKYAKEEKINLYKKIRHEISPCREIFKWYFKKQINYVKSYGVTPDYRPPYYILRDFYAEKRYKKYMDNFNYYDFDKVDKFVYFPLQYQPESQIDVIAPFFSNQIETARLIAMSLPDDYTLVVKEHPTMADKRPPSYVEKIARTINIKLIDYRISSEKVLKKCDLVISPNGTTIAEAAFLKKPVIQLGNLGTTLLMPNVTKHSDFTTLSSCIKECLKKNLNTDDYEIKLENYVAAVYDAGFDYNYNKTWYYGNKNMYEVIWRYYKNEISNILGN